MKRRILIGLLGFGTLFGFGSGFASLGECGQSHAARRAQFEAHVADVCVEAANRVDRPPPPAEAGPQTHHHHHY